MWIVMGLMAATVAGFALGVAAVVVACLAGSERCVRRSRSGWERAVAECDRALGD